ncbi:MAG: ATP-binding cassette domain-containing protein [Chromatiaceae bacterium]
MSQQQREIELKTSRQSVGRVALVPDAEYLVGSDEGNPINLRGNGVLPSHAKLYLRDGALWVEPMADAPVLVNGAAVTAGVPVNPGDWMAFGSALVQVFLRDPLGVSGSPAGGEGGLHLGERPAAQEIIVGRLADCGLPIDSPLISREHARLVCTPEQVWLEDLHSTNGTFVNGRRIEGRVALTAGDRVSFATFVFVFSGAALEPAELGGRVRVEARGLAKQVIDRTTKQPRNLLSGIDLAIDPGEFVVIFGTSGSGKSTLLDALNGRRPASAGSVQYNGVDLYSSFDTFRAGIGYVPQQDIVHRKIRVRDALRYTARLRLPPDTSDEEITAYIERVLERVGLQEKGDLAVDTPEPLSGGQLKRVSLAVELVANPNILFLDEATSGLDAGTDKKMMRLFADLAADGRTVICVTHTLENIDSCHLVALLHQGHLVYYGPPEEAAAYFGVERLSGVYEKLETQDAEAWSARFRASPYYQRFVAARMSQTPAVAGQGGAIFDTSGTLLDRAKAESQVAFVLVLSAIWFGCINSAREIVKELPVYLRERSVVVTIPAYITSKLIPLAILCAVQCASFLGIVTLMIDFPGDFGERFLTLFVAGLAATGMGLLVSAFVNSNDKAIAALPLLLIPQFILSNSVVALKGVSETFAQLTVIAYWALDAMHATLERAVLDLHQPNGDPVVTLTGSWSTDIAATAGLACVLVAATVLALKLKDRKV